jgi:hypothetical protein
MGEERRNTEEGEGKNNFSTFLLGKFVINLTGSPNKYNLN